ncbi:hypothetical protein OROGR_004455 [Orobanche gracilis]
MFSLYPDGRPMIYRRRNELFSVKPVNLKFLVFSEPVSSSFQLLNKSDQHVAFRVKSTNPFKYSVEPKTGIVLSRSQINVTVTLVQSQKIPSFVYHDDKFLVQCVATPPGITVEEITQAMFDKDAEHHVEECELVAFAIYNYGGRVKETYEDLEETSEDLEETSEDHTALSYCTMGSSGSFFHKIKKLLKWGPRRYNGGGGMSIYIILLIAVLGFLLGHYL